MSYTLAYKPIQRKYFLSLGPFSQPSVVCVKLTRSASTVREGDAWLCKSIFENSQGHCTQELMAAMTVTQYLHKIKPTKTSALMGSRSHKFLSLVEELLTINAVVGDVSVSSGIWPLKGCSCSCKGPYILVALCGLIVLKNV